MCHVAPRCPTPASAAALWQALDRRECSLECGSAAGGVKAAGQSRWQAAAPPSMPAAAASQPAAAPVQVKPAHAGSVRLFFGQLSTRVSPAELAARLAPFGTAADVTLVPCKAPGGGVETDRVNAFLTLTPPDASTADKAVQACISTVRALLLSRPLCLSPPHSVSHTLCPSRLPAVQRLLVAGHPAGGGPSYGGLPAAPPPGAPGGAYRGGRHGGSVGGAAAPDCGSPGGYRGAGQAVAEHGAAAARPWRQGALRCPHSFVACADARELTCVGATMPCFPVGVCGRMRRPGLPQAQLPALPAGCSSCRGA